MSILFVTATGKVFSNSSTGAEVRSSLFVEALSRIDQVDVVSFWKEPSGPAIGNCKVLFDSPVPVKLGRFARFGRFLRLVFCPKNPYTYYPESWNRAEIVARFLKEKQYDLIACRFFIDAGSCGLFRYADKLVLDVDDNPVAKYVNARADQLAPSFWNRFITRRKANGLASMARDVLNRVHCSFYSNPQESPCERSVYLHNVSTMKIENPVIDDETPLRLFFVGHLDYFPNKNGICHFVKDIFPGIRARIPEACLYIAGKTTDKDLLPYLNSFEGVKALGFVEDITALYRDCRVIVAPVYEGTGTSIKFIEAAMSSRPVVSTPMGVRGFESVFEDGRHFLCARTDEGFVDEVVRLLTDIETSNRMARLAKEAAEANFSADHFCQVVAENVK